MNNLNCPAAVVDGVGPRRHAHVAPHLWIRPYQVDQPLEPPVVGTWPVKVRHEAIDADADVLLLLGQVVPRPGIYGPEGGPEGAEEDALLDGTPQAWPDKVTLRSWWRDAVAIGRMGYRRSAPLRKEGHDLLGAILLVDGNGFVRPEDGHIME